jgi:serine/threonine-protein kinase
MATVYLAHDLRYDRPVAFKLLRPEISAGMNAERFRREIATAARLQHPHICSVYDSGEEGGQLWFTMPYVRGETLRARLKRERRLPIADALRITQESAEALAHAHRAGIVHRDVKPENILLTEDGVPMLADFGIALHIDKHSGEHLTEQGHHVGTPLYMAPEQAMAERAGPQADQFALAAVCYEMLAGAPPHAGPTIHATLARRLSRPAPGVRSLRSEVPEHVERALERALAMDPDDRFPTIGEFGEALEPGAVVARPRMPRSAWIAVAAVATLLAALLVSGVGRTAAPTDPAPAAAGRAPVTRLAVLPFTNLGDSADAYFAEGMADELRGKLAGLPGLEVIARGSSSQYQETGKSPARIGAELGARYLLTGTVRWEKGIKRNRVRVSPELIEASTGVTRWQQPFDAAFTDVFEVQASIADQVAGALHLALADSTRARLTARPTRSLEAYARFLRSRELRSGEIYTEALRAAITELQTAVRLDSQFVAAWAELSQVQVDAFRHGGLMIADAEAARASLQRAKALAPGSPDVLAAQARYKLVVDGDFAGALQDYRAALRILPNRSEWLSAAGAAELDLNRYPEAVADLEHAARLDPRSPDAAGALGAAYLRLRRYHDARGEIDRARSLRPSSLSLAYGRMRLAAAEGDLATARQVLREMEATAGPRAVAAYVALREDLIWMLEDDQLRIMTTLTPADLDGGRGDWALALAEAHRFLGDTARSRAYGDSAAAAYAEMLAGWGNRRDRGQIVVTRALALALAGRITEALTEADLAGRLQPLGSGQQSPYVAYVRSRVDAMAGDSPRAIARLDSVLATPAHVSRGWYRIDRTLAPLRGQPGFQALIRQP